MQRYVQPECVTSLDYLRELRVEIETIEALHGPNPYCDYLRKHRRRPNSAEAAAIGRIMGARVKADDGTMQPRQSRRGCTA
jgi:hypothetical protein